jgi:hypothetical protein
MTSGSKILATVLVAMLAAPLAIGLIYVAGASDRADDAAIGKAVACVIAKNYLEFYHDYPAEVAARRAGEMLLRQMISDMRAQGTERAGRVLIVAHACQGAPDPDPAPLPLVTSR